MSEQESERPGGTQPGLKKSDVLTRQTGDGSFEFIVEPSSSDGYEPEPPIGLSDDLPLLARSGGKKRIGLIGAVVVLLTLVIGVGIVLSQSADKSGKADDAPTKEQEVSGFKPYGGVGGGEAASRAERTKLERRAERQRVIKQVEEPEEPEAFEEQFVQEIAEEMPPNAEPVPEAEWQVSETEPDIDEDPDPISRVKRMRARDHINFRRAGTRSIQSQAIRSLSVSDHKRAMEIDQNIVRNLEPSRRNAQPDDSVDEDQNDDMYYESGEEEFDDEPLQGSELEGEYFDDEEELEEENY